MKIGNYLKEEIITGKDSITFKYTKFNRLKFKNKK